jgi:hypothetical protein
MAFGKNVYSFFSVKHDRKLSWEFCPCLWDFFSAIITDVVWIYCHSLFNYGTIITQRRCHMQHGCHDDRDHDHAEPSNGSKRSSLHNAVCTRSIVMVTIPIHNETTYTLTDDMTQHILRDAHDHFGEEVHAIRVQSGRERHALNTRTREVRYAFSPQDFGFGHTMPIVQEPPRSRRRFPRRDAEIEAAILPVPFEDIEMDAEAMEPLDPSLERLAAGRDEDEEADIFTLDNPLDNPVEDVDEDEEDNVLDSEDEED